MTDERDATTPALQEVDRIVTFIDEAGTEYSCAVPSLGHTVREVRSVAYRWACGKVFQGDWSPHGDLRYVRTERLA